MATLTKPDSRRFTPRLTHKVFWDLALYMVALGLAMGLVFPTFVRWLGVPRDATRGWVFPAACLTAGFVVGALNYWLARSVVGSRVRFLNRRLHDVGRTIDDRSSNGSVGDPAPRLSRLSVDSQDELGQTATAFNRLLEALEREEHSRRECEAELRYQALHDSLTRLPNRDLFFDRVEHLVTDAARSDRTFAVLLVDLDNFKPVNDTMGHEIGDALLREVAARLLTCVRPGDTVARLGGDEFAILLPDSGDETLTIDIADRVARALCAPLGILGTKFTVQASIGIAEFSKGEQAADVVRRADLAMYRAKANGKNQCCRFDQRMRYDAPITSRR